MYGLIDKGLTMTNILPACQMTKYSGVASSTETKFLKYNKFILLHQRRIRLCTEIEGQVLRSAWKSVGRY